MAEFDEASHKVPFELEAPTPIMFWEPVEFVTAISIMGFGIISKLWVIGMLGGGLVLWGSKYLKRGQKRGMIQHLLWAFGLQLDQNLKKKFKPAWLNDFIE